MSRAPPVIGRRSVAGQEPAGPTREAIAEGGSHDPERRQLTALFCDMVDSAVLASLLDPEDLRDVMQAYLDACTETIAAFGGYVACYMGDGVLGFFGYPLAFEDAAERAIHAGFRLLAVTR